jgi:hypothetical protein
MIEEVLEHWETVATKEKDLIVLFSGHYLELKPHIP